MPSLESRLVMLQLVLSAGVITAFACSALWLSSRTLAREEERELAATAAQVAESVSREWDEEGDLRRAAISALSEQSPVGVRIEVLDEQHRPVHGTPAGTGPGPRAKKIEVTLPLPRGKGWVVATGSAEARRRAMTALIAALAIAAVPLFLSTLAVSRVLARRALRPLSRMAEQAEEASRGGGTQALGSATDPAEVATLAGSFNRLLARLGTMLRMERNFTQDAAHELRTPLTVLSGELEHAAGDPTLTEGHLGALRRALEQARQMSALVEALLLLRRTDDEMLVRGDDDFPINLSDLARDVAAELSREHPERIGDILVTADDEVLVPGRATLLSAAIRNLFSNAIKFSDAGMPVRISVCAGRSQHSVVVEDGGPGIPPGEMDRIFDPFYRGPEARAEKTGFGLGLPLLRRVARAHGGDVRVDRSDLGGARFELHLPTWKRAPEHV